MTTNRCGTSGADSEPRDWVMTIWNPDDGDSVDALFGPYTQSEASEAEAAALDYYTAELNLGPGEEPGPFALPRISSCRLERWADPT